MAKVEPELLSIGDICSETGLSADVVRVWERRYGFPQPARDAAGDRGPRARRQRDRLSHRGHEIMRLLQALNREDGITIVMVTHEEDIAAYANRLIIFADGKVRSDAPVPERAGA